MVIRRTRTKFRGYSPEGVKLESAPNSWPFGVKLSRAWVDGHPPPKIVTVKRVVKRKD